MLSVRPLLIREDVRFGGTLSRLVINLFSSRALKIQVNLFSISPGNNFQIFFGRLESRQESQN